MRITFFQVILSGVFVFMGAGAALGQLRKVTPPLPVQEIIHRFAAAESQNRIARDNYTYTQDFDIKTLGIGGFITGDYRRVSDILYDDHGNRIEKITFFPASTLTEMSITPEDLQDLEGIQPFALTEQDLPKYTVQYAGKERIDELDTYVFDVAPKKLERGQRYLQGRIWVDDQDLQIVKVAGKGVPDDADNKYPHFESYREDIDGKFWFPTYVYADDELDFKNNSVHVRMVVKFTKYKKFTTNIRIADEPVDQNNDNPDAKKPDEKPAPQPEKHP